MLSFLGHSLRGFDSGLTKVSRFFFFFQSLLGGEPLVPFLFLVGPRHPIPSPPNFRPTAAKFHAFVFLFGQASPTCPSIYLCLATSFFLASLKKRQLFLFAVLPPLSIKGCNLRSVSKSFSFNMPTFWPPPFFCPQVQASDPTPLLFFPLGGSLVLWLHELIVSVSGCTLLCFFPRRASRHFRHHYRHFVAGTNHYISPKKFLFEQAYVWFFFFFFCFLFSSTLLV